MKIVMGKPNKKQEEFLKDKHKHVAFGGARGGGKSWAVRFKAKALCLKHAGITVMIIRQTYPELMANHIRPLKKDLMIGTKDAVAKYNDKDKLITFANGSKLLFGYCATDKDLDRYQGTEVDVLFLDEACNLSEFQMKTLVAIVRGVNNFPKRIYYTCNPSGQGMIYVKRLFVDRKFEIGEDPEEYSFIQSLVTDNVALMESDPDYIKQLEALPNKLREAWLNGRWDIWQGMFFDEFRTTPDPQKCYEAGITIEEALDNHQWTHVIEPFDIPKDWKVYRSYDWGYGKPFSVGWHAVDYDGVAYRILELYGCTSTPNEGIRWSNKEQMDKIAEIEREHPWLKGRKIRGVADPSIWDGSHGISCAEEADKHGIWFEKGINDRIAGWMQFRERLRFDENGKAMYYVFNTCKACIRTVPLQMHDEHKPEDLDTDLEDHCPDEIRYFCMMRPIAPRKIITEKKPMHDPLDQYTKPNRAIIRRI